MRRLLAIAMASLALGACERDDSGPALSEGDLRGRDRGREMVTKGKLCDSGADGQRDLTACHRACELNHSNSCGWLGEAYAHGRGVAVDRNSALQFFERACDGGSGLGCEGLARMTDDPEVARAKFANARIVYRVHCSQGHRTSCERLAVLHADGLGGPRSEPTALTYWQRACALGSAAACERRPTAP